MCSSNHFSTSCRIFSSIEDGMINHSAFKLSINWFSLDITVWQSIPNDFLRIWNLVLCHASPAGILKAVLFCLARSNASIFYEYGLCRCTIEWVICLVVLCHRAFECDLSKWFVSAPACTSCSVIVPLFRRVFLVFNSSEISRQELRIYQYQMKQW